MTSYEPSTAPDDATEQQIYRDAWRIADPGACNPVAVAGTLARASAALLHRLGTNGVRKHPALRVMAAQLAMLYDVDSIGAEVSVYNAVYAASLSWWMYATGAVLAGSQGEADSRAHDLGIDARSGMWW